MFNCDGILSMAIAQQEIYVFLAYFRSSRHMILSGCLNFCRALECQAFLDSATERDLNEVLGFRELIARASSSAGEGSSRRQEQETRKNQVLATAEMKFTYVVAAQLYGKQKKSGANQANGIAYLLETYKGLRIAYVDEVGSGPDMQYFSVLVKYDRVAQKEVEIFRVQLPGPLKLGEGKPENQNHALIFTRGDAVQTIDMNQVIIFCTANCQSVIILFDQILTRWKRYRLVLFLVMFQTASVLYDGFCFRALELVL